MAFLSICFLLGLILSGVYGISEAADEEKSSDGRVFIVLAVDTEPARPDPWTYAQPLDFGCFEKDGDHPQIANVMDSLWRSRYRDACGGLPRFTWFIMSHEVFCHSPTGECGIVYRALLPYRESIKSFGDEIGWHYHHADWYDPDGDGRCSWNQLTTFDGTKYTDGADIELAERALNCMIVDWEFFPSAFRSGWVWENDDFSRWLEGIIPFDFSAYPPNRGNRTPHEPARNQYDWSRAPRSYSGYHPHYNDYQRPGRMRRWIFRTMAPNDRHEWERIFLATAREGDQVLCYTGHSYNNLREDIDKFLPEVVRMGDSLDIPVIFATASEAGAAISENSDSSRLQLDIVRDGDGVLIQANRPIFQRRPYCIIVPEAGSYERIRLLPSGPNRWSYRLSDGQGIKLICAASTLDNQRTTAEYEK